MTCLSRCKFGFCALALLVLGDGIATADVRLDLVLPGISHSFDLRWSFGDGQGTSGIATDHTGSIYTTVDLEVVSLSANGVEQWRTTCPNGGCTQIATNGSAVFGSLFDGGVVRVNSQSGSIECTYAPGDLDGSLFNQYRVLATDSFVVLYETVVVILDATTCSEVARIASPNDQEAGSLVADEDLNVLFVAWDDPGVPLGSESPVTLQYALDTGTLGCQVFSREGVISENFRAMLVGSRYFAGTFRDELCAYNALTCEIEACQHPPHPSDIGDLRDVGFDALRNRIYFLGNSAGQFSFTSLDGSSFRRRSFYDNFVDKALHTLNKFAVGGDYAFIPDGDPDEKGDIQVFHLDKLTKGPFARFERGRQTRLGHRLIDGGLFLTQRQRGIVSNPDTPLMAYHVGDGNFVGQGDSLGGADGNKYCDTCITELRFVESRCQFVPGGWGCDLKNHYDHTIVNPTIVLPSGTWNARTANGVPLGSTDQRDLLLPISIAPGVTEAIVLAGRVFPAPGQQLKIVDPEGSPKRRFLLLKSSRDAIHVPPPGSNDPIQIGGRMRFTSERWGDTNEMEFPAAGWTGLGNPAGSRGYRFSGSPGDPCEDVRIKPGRQLRIRCRGEGFEPTLDEGSQRSLDVTVNVGDVTMCMTFASPYKRRDQRGIFHARRAPAPTDCMIP